MRRFRFLPGATALFVGLASLIPASAQPVPPVAPGAGPGPGPPRVPTTPAAAARAVVRLKPPDAAPALLGYLPTADTEAVADDIRAALVALALRDGKPEPALVAALNDPSPVRRAAAYVALVEGGPAGERV